MFKKLSIKISAYIVLVLLLVIGSVSAIYITNSKSMYVSREITQMQTAYRQIKKINFKTQKQKIDDVLDKYEDQVYTLVICKSNSAPVYSSKKERRTQILTNNKIVANLNMYSHKAIPKYEMNENGTEKITLRKICTQNNTDYYIHMEESLRPVDSVFSYTNKFLLLMLLLFVVVSVVAVFLLVNKATRPLRKLSLIAGEISKKNYSIRYSGKITDDEIGVLAENLNNMADTIQENINVLNNYNFLLKEDNSRMREYENMRKRVLCNVTHELKTPLAIISSQVEMIKCSSDNSKKEYYYESAMDEINKMSKLISRLLNFSSGEREIFKSEQQTVDLSDKFNRLYDTFTVLNGTKKIRFNKNIENGCVIDIAPTHIDHIFNNYLMNAMQHVIPGGEINVTLKKSKNGFLLTVYNDGEQISDENIENIWTDFYKSGSIKGNNQSRTGLGLFIVKEISVTDHAECGAKNTSNGVEFRYEFITKKSEV